MLVDKSSFLQWTLLNNLADMIWRYEDKKPLIWSASSIFNHILVAVEYCWLLLFVSIFMNVTDLHPDPTHFLGFWDLTVILPLSHCILGIQFDQWNLHVQEVPEKKWEHFFYLLINLSGMYPNLEENFLRTQW